MGVREIKCEVVNWTEQNPEYIRCVKEFRKHGDRSSHSVKAENILSDEYLSPVQASK